MFRWAWTWPMWPLLAVDDLEVVDEVWTADGSEERTNEKKGTMIAKEDVATMTVFFWCSFMVTIAADYGNDEDVLLLYFLLLLQPFIGDDVLHLLWQDDVWCGGSKALPLSFRCLSRSSSLVVVLGFSMSWSNAVVVRSDVDDDVREVLMYLLLLLLLLSSAVVLYAAAASAALASSARLLLRRPQLL